MTSNRLKRAAACLAIFCAGLGVLLYVRGHASANSQAPPSLEVFFQTVLRNPSTLPKLEDLHTLTESVASTRPEDVTRALPAVFAALNYQDETVKAYACAALFAIAGRPDGAELLKSHIDAIGHDLLTSPFANIQAGEVVILGRVKPTPPESVTSLSTFVKQPDRDANAQSGAIFELVRIAPENPEVAAAIQEFLSRPMGSNTKIGILNALGNPGIKDVQLIAAVTASLDDPDENIRSTAIQALMRIGKQALQQAEPALQRLANDPNQPADVRAAAKDALQRLHPPNKDR